MGLNAVCFHGHFYQPPREDPLSGLIPDETGAEPYRNWNERIHAECYRPNAELGNFSKASFNIGPTLFKWMETHDKATYETIIEHEQDNYNKYGVGNALAQAYHHVILPLASKNDKTAQVKWGIADFEYRFGHAPMGMWLPETGVDLETLVILSDYKIKFTILAPWQIELPPGHFHDQPYLIELPGNRDPMIVFSYHQDLSTMISFDSYTTRSGDNFIDQQIVPGFAGQTSNHNRLLLIASDGEAYGHHKRFRDKFLSYMLNGALQQRGLSVTYPGLWLLNHQPETYAKLNENTSWSCHHGVKRWERECGCTPGAVWKKPLRDAFNKMAKLIDYQFEAYLRKFTEDVWQLRDDFIYVVLGQQNLFDLLNKYSINNIKNEEIEKIDALLKAQYERQRIFTSCAWFHNEFERIEPQNNIAYAAQAIWLTYLATHVDLAPSAINLLKEVKDNQTGLSGDIVFLERYRRIKELSDTPLPYSKFLSSFSI